MTLSDQGAVGFPAERKVRVEIHHRQVRLPRVAPQQDEERSQQGLVQRCSALAAQLLETCRQLGVQLEAKARAMGMPEVDYFLERFAPSFRKTLDEISE